MKGILRFIQATLTGGVMFLLPLVLFIVLFSKAYNLVLVVAKPLSEKMPDFFMGLDGSRIIAITILVLICFLSGLLVRSKAVRRLMDRLEEKVLILVPGYTLIKSVTADALGEQIERKLITVLVKEDEGWKMGYLSDENTNYSTVFFPEAPRSDSGEVMIIPSEKVIKLDVPANETKRSLKRFGYGILQHLEKDQRLRSN